MEVVGRCWRPFLLNNGELEHRTALEQRRVRSTLIITTTLSIVE
jgi:hypothetical protein